MKIHKWEDINHKPRPKRPWRLRAAWRLALVCWRLHLDRLGNHFEDVAWCGKRWFA